MNSVFVLFAFVVSIINAHNGAGKCTSVIEMGARNTCVLDTNSHVHCFGKDEYNMVVDAPSEVVFSQIASGVVHVCGIVAEDMSLKCWGHPDTDGWGHLSHKDGKFTDVCTYGVYNCAVQEDGYLYCWGKDGQRQFVSRMPTDGGYKRVACGYAQVCAMKTDSTIVCWGNVGWDYEKVQTEIPPVQFEDITLGTKHACGLKADDSSIVCWGHDDYDLYKDIPEGVAFDMIYAVSWGFVAIKSDDKSMLCLSHDVKGIVSGCPEGEFRSVGCTYNSCCAVNTNDDIVCWGFEKDADQTFKEPMESTVKPRACGAGGASNSCTTEQARIEELEADVATKKASIEELEGEVATKQAKIVELETTVVSKDAEIQLWKSRFSEVEKLELDGRLSVAALEKFPESESEVGHNAETNSFSNVLVFMMYIAVVFGVFGVGNYLGKKAHRTTGYTEMSQM